MAPKDLGNLLKEQFHVMNAANVVLEESFGRATVILAKPEPRNLSVEERESLEALTARYSRLCDYLFQRVFRTIDKIELSDEGTAIDRLNRMEKRGLIASAEIWRQMRELRNLIAHEYVIESNDQVLLDAFKNSTELFETVKRIRTYSMAKGYLSVGENIG